MVPERAGRVCVGLSAPHVLPLLAILTALLPLAGASLPDPLWLAGVYDGGDYDDLVAQAGDGSPSVSAILIAVAPGPGRVVVPVAAPDRLAGPGPGALLSRAPPSA